MDHHCIYTTRGPSSSLPLVCLLDAAPPSHSYDLEQLDLSSLDNVRKFAKSINARVASGSLPPLRAVLINATVWQANGQKFSPDGSELNFAANYLANFLLILLLLQSMDKDVGRIVFTSSAAHDPSSWGHGRKSPEEEQRTFFRNPDELAHPAEDQPEDEANAGVRRYGMSKMLLIMFMYELQRRLDSNPQLWNVSLLALDPGTMGGTGLVRSGSLPVRLLMKYMVPPITWIAQIFQPNGLLRTPYKSGSGLLHATLDEASIGKHPKALYLDGTALAQPCAEAQDQSKQRRLWDCSLRLARVRKEDALLNDVGV
ncbi:Putative NAD(P)-binding domain superfamily [Septoria linicola]|uniref:NAD(P)-binding domain superfamily n=1 Tax=Septoria linicola TaxID=215465 RepID=A0A9Q9ELE2_9PEZI|nr:Putative NAD(P)-binding domain superfamily [Septoria linicola]